MALRHGLILAAALLLPAGRAGAEEDSDRARASRAAGLTVPLESLVEWVEQRYHGRLLEAELEEEDGALVYELEWLTPQSTVLEFEFDAHSGRLLEAEGPGLDAARKP
jgi:uncharacterized membrane protein YkoI